MRTIGFMPILAYVMLIINNVLIKFICDWQVYLPCITSVLQKDCTYLEQQAGWLGSQVVSVLDSGAEGPGFKSQPRHCWVTVLGKLFTPTVPLLTKKKNW